MKILREKYGIGEPPPPYEPISPNLVDDMYRHVAWTARKCGFIGVALSGIVAVVCLQFEVLPAITFLLTYMSVIIGGLSAAYLFSKHEDRNQLKEKST